MAGKKDPSIYDDRSTIGSSDDLDEYGVWVKSEPQDLSSSLPDLPDIEELPDIAGLDADDSDLPDFSDFSSSEPDDLALADDEFNLPGDSLNLADDSLSLSDDSLNLADDSLSLADDSLDLSDDSLSLADDSLSLPDDGLSLADDSLSLADESLSLADDSLSLADDSLSLADESLDLPGDSFNLSDDELALPDDTLALSDDNLDLSNDDFDLPEPDTSSLSRPELSTSAPGLPDDEDDDDLPDGGFLGPLGGPDLEFQELSDDSTLPESPAPAPAEKNGVYDEVSMDDFLDSDPSPKKIDFGNLDDVIGGEKPAKKAQSSQNQGGADLSNQLLMKIADELSSIKKEISSLKAELSIVRSEVKTETPESKGGGFFDEEDDEKIALTGDELDNILHTADFIEEAGSDERLSNDLSFEDGTASLSDQENSIDETPEEPLAEEAIDLGFDAVSSGDEDEEFEVPLDLDAGFPDFSEEPSELNNLREMGAKPVTFPPEDTSYLEADPLASGAVEIDQDEQIDLSGAVIDEPDLSSQITENPVLEPVIDNISIDVDMEDVEIEEQIMPGISGSDDFVFEVEETMEIPVEDIDEALIEEDESFEESSGFTAPEDSFDTGSADDEIPSNLKQELKMVLSYMDQLLESLPEEKIEEFAKSEYFETYKKLFEELGLA